METIKKRLVFTVTNDLNYDQRMQKICGSLAVAGHDVLLVGRVRKSSLPLNEKSFRQKRLKCLFEKGKLFYLEYNLRLFFYLLLAKGDVFCAIDLDTIMAVLWAGKIRSKKLVYDAHEYFTEIPEVMHRPKVQQIWRWVERYSVPKMNLCYTVCQSLANIYETQYQKDFFVIRNVPLLKPVSAIQSPTSIGSDRFILYQGALNLGRGLEELLEAMTQLPIKLKIVGEGDLSESLRAKSKVLGLDNKVEFLGYIRPEQLRELTPRAWLGYNLLADLGKSYYYSLSNKFFDYIHAGVPGLSNDFPEYSAINKFDKVAVLTNLCVENIVLSIEELIANSHLYEELKQNCSLAREKHNWQEEEKLLIRLFDDV